MTAKVIPVEDRGRDRVEEVQEAPPPGLLRRVVVLILKAAVPLALLVGAGLLARELFMTAPIAEREARPRVPRLVEVVEARPATQGPRIEAWGEVAAARTLVLRPEAGGTIMALSDNLTPGGLVREGEELVRLDDREQRLLVAQAEAEIRQIDARISIEQGQQERAKRDIERLPRQLTDAQRLLVLRAPQMAELRAELAAAEAARERALVDLSHMVIRAPFDALVLDEEVALGTMLTAGSAPATLVAADRFHVQVAVPVSALDWIDTSAGQVLRLTQPGVWPDGAFREGRVERLTAGLSEAGRMAELVVAVDDPLSRLPQNRGKPRLLLGSFLKAVGEGRQVENAVVLDRAYLRDHDKVWVMAKQDELEIRKVEVAWRGASEVLISGGLAPGERIVTTSLAIVAPGMKLRLGEAAAIDATGAEATSAGGSGG
ncbi:MAG: efflux RND transporter periplasmic adaptor subunit [Paracoccaceae bacterium]|nr:efflux RND transporter periplasmic adaptor subunit [Paracoccaceae bacterium]